MEKQMPEELFDVRVAHRYLTRGKITKADYDKFIENLPDLKDSLEMCEASQELLDKDNPADETVAESKAKSNTD